MFKITLADGTVVWVDGSFREEVDEVIAGCGVKAVEEQEVSMHAPQDAELFDLSGTQNDFKGKQRLRFCALESYVRALNTHIQDLGPFAWQYERRANLSSSLALLAKEFSEATRHSLTGFERSTVCTAIMALLGIQHALNADKDWGADTVQVIAELVRGAGLPLLDEEDANLTWVELAEKYQQDEHPLFTRKTWQEKVANDETLLGYWIWVNHKLNED